MGNIKGHYTGLFVYLKRKTSMVAQNRQKGSLSVADFCERLSCKCEQGVSLQSERKSGIGAVT